jgi:hypothetical protein
VLKILGPAPAAVMSLLGRGPAAKEVKRSGAASRGRGRGRGKAGFGRDAGPALGGEGGLEAAANGKRRERGDELEGGLMINLDNVDNLHEIDQAKLQLKVSAQGSTGSPNSGATEERRYGASTWVSLAGRFHVGEPPSLGRSNWADDAIAALSLS